MKTTPPVEIEETEAYKEGRLANIEQEAQFTCPYPMKAGTVERVAWFSGWWNSELNSKLCHIFRKYGVGCL